MEYYTLPVIYHRWQRFWLISFHLSKRTFCFSKIFTQTLSKHTDVLFQGTETWNWATGTTQFLSVSPNRCTMVKIYKIPTIFEFSPGKKFTSKLNIRWMSEGTRKGSSVRGGGFPWRREARTLGFLRSIPHSIKRCKQAAPQGEACWKPRGQQGGREAVPSPTNGTVPPYKSHQEDEQSRPGDGKLGQLVMAR